MYGPDSAARVWEVISAVAALLPRPRLVEHWDEFDGAVLVLADHLTPQRRLRVDHRRGLELLAEHLFAPLSWGEVTTLGTSRVARRVARSMGHDNGVVQTHYSSSVAALLARDDGELVGVRAAMCSTIDGVRLLPEVQLFSAITSALTDTFESAVSGHNSVDSVEAWLVFRNGQAVEAVTANGEHHRPD